MPGQHESSSTMRVILPTEARMRGDDRQQAGMWSYLPLEQRVPPDHPLRPIRGMVDGILAELSPEFGQLYARVGRPSIAPEKLLRALLLQVLYSVRSERVLMESAGPMRPMPRRRMPRRSCFGRARVRKPSC